MLSASSAPLYRLGLAPSTSIGVPSIRSFALSITCSFITCIHHWLLHVSSKLIMINYWYSVLLHLQKHRKKDSMIQGCKTDTWSKMYAMLGFSWPSRAAENRKFTKAKFRENSNVRWTHLLTASINSPSFNFLKLKWRGKLWSFVINRRNVRMLTAWNEPSWKWAESVHYT